MFVKPTKLEDAKKKLIETISLKNETVKIPIVNSLDRVNCSTIKSEINLPSTTNSAVDGYGILHKSIVSNPQLKLKVEAIQTCGVNFLLFSLVSGLRARDYLLFSTMVQLSCGTFFLQLVGKLHLGSVILARPLQVLS